MASVRFWIGIILAIALAGCASRDVPDDAKLIYSGPGIKFVNLEGPPKSGTLFVYDEALGRVVYVVPATEPQSDFGVVNAADGHDVKVYWEK